MVSIRKHRRRLQESGQSGESSGSRVGKKLNTCSSSVEKLHHRELGARTRLAFAKPGNIPDKFQNFQLQEQYDMFDESATQLMNFQFLEGRSKIMEIIAANDFIFALSESGLGFVYSNRTNKCICCLNMSADESIGRIFYNKFNKSVITVFLYRSEYFLMWRFRSTSIECIRRNQFDDSIPIFETDLPPSDGFYIFSDEDNKFLRYRDNDGLRVYDLMNYSLLYLVPCTDLENIRISPEMLTLISERTPDYVHLRFLSVEDGKEHGSFDLPLLPYKSIEFIEQFNEKLIFKQEDEDLHILDVRNFKLVDVKANNSWNPATYTFLYNIHHFLTDKDNKIEVMNLKGEFVTKFEDHDLFYDVWDNENHISNDHELLISYCRDKDGGGSINMSDIRNGKCICKISANDPRLKVSPRVRGSTDESSNQRTIKQALEKVSAIYFDEDQNAVYSGNEEGFIHVWSN